MKKMNYCYECGERLAQDARSCDSCGKVYRREKGDPSALEIVKRSLCLFVAFLFLLSAFTPIIYTAVDEGEFEATVKLSAFDIIDATVASFNNYSASEILDTELYQENAKAAEKFGEYVSKEHIAFSEFDYDELDSEGRRLFKGVVLASLKLSMAMDSYATSPAFVVASVVAALYMLVCVGAFILALVSFIGGFISVMRSERLFRYSVKLILLSTVGAFAALIAFAGAMWGENVRLGGFALMGVIATLALALALWIIRRVTGDERFNIATVIKRGVAVVVCFAAIMLCFAPLYKTTVKTEFSGSEKKSTVSFYYNYTYFSHIMNDDEIDAIKDKRDEIKDADDKKAAKKEFLKEQFEAFGQYELKDAKEGDAYVTDYQMRAALLTVSNSSSAYKIANLFSITEVTMVIAAILLALAMYESLKYFAIGKSRGGLYRVYAVCGALAALITVLLSVVYVVMLCGGLDYAPKGYGIGIAAGAIIFAVLSIAAACLPRGSEDAPSKKAAVQPEQNEQPEQSEQNEQPEPIEQNEQPEPIEA